MLKIKKFDKGLEKVRKRAQILFDKKQETVVCKYCGKLLLKKEAGSVYDIEKAELSFFHEECFDKNETVGTLEDLIGVSNKKK